MRAYFSQFGDILNLRLSRNRKTGASKHFAFVEFASSEVAKIVASTMDNYLMFGHILKCKYVPSDRLHPDTWKGANRRYKATPWNKLERERLAQPKTKETWEKKVRREEAKRAAKAAKMKELGYDFKAPKLKSVDDIVKQKEDNKSLPVAPDADDNDTSAKAIEAPASAQTSTAAPQTSASSEKRRDKREKAESDATGPEAQLARDLAASISPPAAVAVKTDAELAKSDKVAKGGEKNGKKRKANEDNTDIVAATGGGMVQNQNKKSRKKKPKAKKDATAAPTAAAAVQK